MRTALLAFFLIASIAQAEKVDPETKKWKRAGFGNPELSSIETTPANSEIQITHLLDATVVLFRNSGWTKDSITSHLNRTNEIFAQCGISMGKIDFVEADAPQGKLDINERWSTEGDDYRISKATPTEQRPVIYLMRSILPKRSSREGAFTNIESFWVPLEPIMQNTIWISNVINSPDYGNYYDMTDDGKSILKVRDPSYNVVAHEIAHLLGNMGHETDLKEKNLLNGDSASLNDHLLPRQCAKFKESPLLKPLTSK